jgi:hypothetical protein
MNKTRAALAVCALIMLAACGDEPAGEDAAGGAPEAQAGAAADTQAEAGPAFDRENAPTTWEHPAYPSAEAQYMARFEAAGSDSDEADFPDWSGLWENARFQGYPFALRPGETPTGRGLSTETTMALTPRYAAEYEARVRLADAGEDFDPLSWCLPAGFPRQLGSVFPREFAPAPGTTFIINEGQNEIRRIYTDGRGHMSPDFAYPRWDGDSVGFWDGDTLVIWTTNVKGNLTGRDQPAVSDQLQTYEEWTKAADDVMRVRVTFYDPVALEEPFDFVRYYQKADDMGGELRATFSACNENQSVVLTSGGGNIGAIPGVDDGLDLSNAETWLMFEEAEESGLIAEFEAAAAAGAPPPVRPAPAEPAE